MADRSKPIFSPLTDRAAAGVLVLTTAVLFWQIVFRGRVLYWGDVMLQFVPWRGLANELLRAGELPLWNPYSFCGEPFLANPQVAVFYPWNVLGLLLSPERCVSWGAVVHTLLLAWAMYLFLKELRLGPSAALMGSLAFAFGGCLLSRHQFPSLIDTVVWLPLALLWTLRVAARPTAGRVAMLTVITAVHLLAGHTQMSLFIFVLQGVAVLLHMFALPQGDGRVPAGIGWALFGVVTGCLAAGIQLGPTAEWVQHSTRSALTMADITRFSLPWWQLPGLVFPALFGSPGLLGNYWGAGNFWEVCGYVGTAPLLLAMCGAVVSRRRERWVLVGLLVVGLLLALGRYAPFYEWAVWCLPLLRIFRDPARFLLFATFSLSVLAAFGVEALYDSEVSARAGHVLRKLTVALAAACTVGLGLAVLAMVPLRQPFERVLELCLEEGGKSVAPGALSELAFGALVGGVLVLVLGLVWVGLIYALLRQMAARKLAWSKAAMPLAALTIVELWVNGSSLNPTTTAAAFQTESEIAAIVRSNGDWFRCFMPQESVDAWWDRYASYVRFGKSDQATVEGAIHAFAPNLHLPQRVQSATGYNPVRVRWLWEALQQADEHPTSIRSLGFFASASVRHVIRFDPNEARLLLHPRQPAYPRASIWPSGTVPSESPPTGLHRPSPPRDATFAANRVSLLCESNHETTLVLSDTFYPGWRVWVDGRPRPIRCAFAVFRSVDLEPGEHRVEFVYVPQSLRFGAFVALCSLLCLAVVGARQFVRQRAAVVV